MKKAYEQSPVAVKKWLDEDYPNIAARAKAEGAEVHWGDESGLRSDDVRGRGYAPKGETPVIRVNNKRHSLSVISTVTNKGQMRWKIFDGALNANILIDFLRRLIRGHEESVPGSGQPSGTPRQAGQGVAGRHTDAIEVFYLPSYSPELNPDEMANADIKQGVTTRAPARTNCTWSGPQRAICVACNASPSGSASTSSMNPFATPLDLSSIMPAQ